MQVGTSSPVTVSTSALLAMTRFCPFGRSVNFVVLASFLSSCLVFGGGGMGAVESWITVTQRLGPTVRQRGNKNWNNLQDRHVCPPNCALTRKRFFWFAVRVCAVRYLCLSPYPWLTPSKCFGARSSPCPLVFPAMSHVTSPTFALLVCLLAPCICFCSFLFFAVSLRPGDGLPSPPHNTVGCAKVMMNHIPPTRCLKTKINTNADFHTPNHAVQHGAGFTTVVRYPELFQTRAKFWACSKSLLAFPRSCSLLPSSLLHALPRSCSPFLVLARPPSLVLALPHSSHLALPPSFSPF